MPGESPSYHKDEALFAYLQLLLFKNIAEGVEYRVPEQPPKNKRDPEAEEHPHEKAKV
jgi:hypothetical protein